MIDLFYTAPKLDAKIAARPKGVLHNHGTNRFEDNGCYFCVFFAPKRA